GAWAEPRTWTPPSEFRRVAGASYRPASTCCAISGKNASMPPVLRRIRQMILTLAKIIVIYRRIGHAGRVDSRLACDERCAGYAQDVPLNAPAIIVGSQSQESFKDRSDCPEMIAVPAGTFRMGFGSRREGNGPRKGSHWGTKRSILKLNLKVNDGRNLKNWTSKRTSSVNW